MASDVRGRGASKFKASREGSGLLCWTNNDPESEPSKDVNAVHDGRESSVPHDKDEPERSRGQGTNRKSGTDHPADKHLKAKRRDVHSREVERNGGDSRKNGDSHSHPRSDRREKGDELSRWIKMDNIPSIARPEHIKSLLTSKDSKVLQCFIDHGIAHVCFERPEQAVQALKQYDGGDLNGNRLSVQLQSVPPKIKSQPGRRSLSRRKSHDKVKRARSRSPR
mmetsp:Transcript_48777/g.80882  ORF Transcript_48777/g.80882 Transcript_48777/m.80882 type:complete len:223 (+) Transcript_48777:89-757(+)